MAELQPAVLFRYENWIHAVSQAETQNEARIDVNVAFNGYRYWTLIFSQRASKGTGSRYQDGFVIGMSGGNNDTQNWIGEIEDLDFKMIRRGTDNFTKVSDDVSDTTQWIGHVYFSTRHGFEDLVTYKFICDTQTKVVRAYMNQIYLGYGTLNFPTAEYSNGRLEVLKTWAQLGDSNCVSYLGDVWLWGCQTLEDAEGYNGGYNPGHKSKGQFLVHHSTHPSGMKMVSDSSHRMYGWKIGDPYDPLVPPDNPDDPINRLIETYKQPAETDSMTTFSISKVCSLRYLILTFDHRISRSTVKSDMKFRTGTSSQIGSSSSDLAWDALKTTSMSDYKALYFGSTFNVDQSQYSNVASALNPGGSIGRAYYYTAIPATTWARYKIVIDRVDLTVRVYLNNSYIGYGDTWSRTAINSYGSMSTANEFIKNLKIAEATNLATAEAYTGD